MEKFQTETERSILIDPIKELRLDKNFGYKIIDFRKMSAEDERLTKDVLMYISYQHQTGHYFKKDLLGFIDFDIYHFCEIMGLKRNNLQKKHPDPYVFKRSNTPKITLLLMEEEDPVGNRLWDSVLENCLFALANENIVSNYKSTYNNTQRVEVKSFRYLDGISFKKIKVGRNYKNIYQYKISKHFEKNLNNFFFHINVETFIKARKINVDDFYIELNNRISTLSFKKKSEYKMGFLDAAKLMGISTEEVDKYFSKIKVKINAKLKKLENIIEKKEILNLKFEWIRGAEARYKNVLSISWDIKDQEIEKRKTQNTFDDIFLKELYQNLSEFYLNKYSMDHSLEMITSKFLFDFVLNEDFTSIKESKYMHYYVEIKGTNYVKESQIKAYAEQHFKKLARIGEINRKNNNKIICFENGNYFIESKTYKKRIKYGSLHQMIYDLTKSDEAVKSLFLQYG